MACWKCYFIVLMSEIFLKKHWGGVWALITIFGHISPKQPEIPNFVKYSKIEFDFLNQPLMPFKSWFVSPFRVNIYIWNISASNVKICHFLEVIFVYGFRGNILKNILILKFVANFLLKVKIKNVNAWL